MKILFLSRWFPIPTDNGAKLRIYNLLRGLAAKHEVHLLSFADDPAGANTVEMEAICQTVRVVKWKEFRPDNLRALLGFVCPEPRSLVDTYSIEMEYEIRRELSEYAFDLVIPSQWQMTVYRSVFAHLPVLFEEIEVGVLYDQCKKSMGFTRLRAALTWRKHRHFLAKVLANGQVCTVVSERERALLKLISPCSSIYVIPNAVSLQDYVYIHEKPEPNSLIFSGSFRYRPNYEAMVWFIERVLPLIQKQIPEAHLTITGDSAGLKLPICDHVLQTGFVEQLHPLIRRAWVSVVPLQAGGGTRLKILEAMVLGTPVVSTSKGAEGLDVQTGKHLLIADTSEDFARQIISILRDAALRERITADAYQLVREYYDWKVILPQFLGLVEQTASGRIEL